VTVSVPARLHLGFLDLAGGLGRHFGSIGLSISGLKTRMTIAKISSGETRASGPEAERVRHYVETMRHALGLAGSYQATIAQAVPAHAGLGSGTQLALAAAAGVRRLENLPLDVEGDAIRLGRGARSGVGIGLFQRGGLVVDGGRGPADRPAPIVAHLRFPEPWRIVIVLDPSHRGAHGPDEITAFANLPPFPPAAAAHACRLVLMQALPSLAEQDIAGFGAAIRGLQRQLGDYFAPAQGGARFTSANVGGVLDRLERAGAFGIGQSSWGPTGFAFAPTPEEADRLAALARQHPEAQGLDIRICRALNHGAEVIAHAHR
jgi:beta-ribofuranosylaminobenzene 5'-phosphate synthase